MYVMVDVRATGMSGTGFAEALLEEAQVAVMPGESFGAAAAGHVRVALTLPDAVRDRHRPAFFLRRRPAPRRREAAPGGSPGDREVAGSEPQGGADPEGGRPDVEAGHVVEILELVAQNLRAQNDLVGHGIIDADAVEVAVADSVSAPASTVAQGRTHGAVEQRGPASKAGLDAEAADRVERATGGGQVDIGGVEVELGADHVGAEVIAVAREDTAEAARAVFGQRAGDVDIAVFDLCTGVEAGPVGACDGAPGRPGISTGIGAGSACRRPAREARRG
jgi:hypothetical protein